MGSGEEITLWLSRLSRGDEQAARVIWEGYFDKLVQCARRRLDGMACRESDEEDIALSAMYSFCRGMAARRFENVADREDLWKLLVTITARKVTAHRRRHFAAKRGGGRVRGESVFISASHEEGREPGIGDALGSEPTPEFSAMVAENCRTMLDSLGEESLRTVAILTLQGYTAAEVAEKLGCVRRTVERKLARIRDKWGEQQPLPPEDADGGDVDLTG